MYEEMVQHPLLLKYFELQDFHSNYMYVMYVYMWVPCICVYTCTINVHTGIVKSLN